MPHDGFDPVCPRCRTNDAIESSRYGWRCDNCGWDSHPCDEDGYERPRAYDPLYDSED